MKLTISGFVNHTVEISADRWEGMSHDERKEWALRRLKVGGTVNDVGVITDAESHEEVWP